MTDRTSIPVVDVQEVLCKGVIAEFKTLPDSETDGKAFSGEEALNQISEFVPDIILLTDHA